MGSNGRNLLPLLAEPLQYALKLEPHFTTATFDGTVTLKLCALVEGNEVQLHCVDLAIVEATLEYQKESRAIECQNLDGTLILELPRVVSRDSVFTITIRYTGALRDNLIGLYQSTYEGEDGVKHLLATTHMEPNHARSVFPCIDEPDKKSRFIVSAVAKEIDCCLSNMPVVSRQNLGSGKVLVTFAESEPMSTYLVALIIGNLKSISSTESRVPITVYAPAGQELNGYHALEVAVKGLQFYEDIFNCRYPLPKLDLVAMPDLSSGAMENWGLIIFKPVELLLEPMGSSLSRRQRVTEIVLHEISHQWFGNLVTMKYWDSLWLNEGFATWMAKFASNHFYPQWHVWQDFVADTLQQGLELDALRSSHPVERLVRDAGEAEQAYDNIAYRKGSSILRMIAKDLGEKRFLDGIKLYLERHRLGNTVTEDLWIALGDATQQNVKATMAVWAERIGFPVVTITENSSDEAGNDSGEAGEVKIILTQSRFLAAGDTRPDEDATAYPLRISIRTSDNHCKYFDFNEREMKISIAETKFYKVNVDHTGFYRTAYPTQRLRSFGEAARLGLLSTEDKVGIVADAVALAASGSQQTSGLFDLFQGMKSEDEYLVWSQIAKGIKNIRTAWRFQPDLIVRGLKKFAAEIFGSRALEVGWVIQDDDDETMQLFKPLLLDAAGSAGVVDVIEDVLKMFKRYADGDESAIHPDIRDMAFGIALANGGDEVFEAIVKLYKISNNEEEKFCLLGNLGCVNEPALVQKALALAFTDVVRSSELYLLLWCLNESSAGASGLWTWATENWQKLQLVLPPAMLRIILRLMIGGFSTKDQIEQVGAFFSTQDTSQYGQVLAQEIEKVEARCTWVTRDTKDVESWLQKYGYLN